MLNDPRFFIVNKSIGIISGPFKTLRKAEKHPHDYRGLIAIMSENILKDEAVAQYLEEELNRHNDAWGGECGDPNCDLPFCPYTH